MGQLSCLLLDPCLIHYKSMCYGCLHLSCGCHRNENLANLSGADRASAIFSFSFSILMFTAGCRDVVDFSTSRTLKGDMLCQHQWFTSPCVFFVSKRATQHPRCTNCGVKACSLVHMHHTFGVMRIAFTETRCALCGSPGEKIRVCAVSTGLSS